jgi:hypothetical protein
LTKLAVLSVPDAVAVETFARPPSYSKIMEIFPIVASSRQLTGFNLSKVNAEEDYPRKIALDFVAGSAYTPAHQGFLPS